MRIDIQAQHMNMNEHLEAYIQKRLDFSAQKLRDHVSTLSIRFSHVKNAKKGCNKRCKIIATLPCMSEIVIDDTQENFYAATDQAIRRLKRSLSSKIGRRQKLEKVNINQKNLPHAYHNTYDAGQQELEHSQNISYG